MHRRSLLALAALPVAAHAQGFPDRPVTMVVPYAPGGSADVLGRVVAPAMSEVLGQSVVVELRPGAGGNIGAAHVATSARADGYTILLGSLSLASAPALQTIPFDPTKDLVAIGGLGAVASLMVVAPDSPFRSLADVLAAARARPGAITYGSSGPATGSHLAGALLAAQTGVELTHVPYRGSGAVYPGAGHHLPATLRPIPRRADPGGAGRPRLRIPHLARLLRPSGHAGTGAGEA
jgi:tripartite-type tricarboxylate transporter receptor subunit TctC